MLGFENLIFTPLLFYITLIFTNPPNENEMKNE
jgi:hypothetical protein